MSFGWTMPPQTAPSQRALEPLQEQDIQFADGNLVVSPAGDWATVKGTAAARQSVLNEAATAPGELVFRSEYGMGLHGQVKSPLSRDRLESLKAQVMARLVANPRIVKVREVELERVEIDGRAGLQATIRGEGRDGLTLQLAPFVIGGD